MKVKLDTCDIKHVIEWNVNKAVTMIITLIKSIKDEGEGVPPSPLPPTPFLSRPYPYTL